jgi:hypothetical protein
MSVGLSTNEQSNIEGCANWCLEHCIDNIRQVIMCYGDTSTIPWVWSERHDRPAPDAHTTHVCRNFESLQNWAIQRAFTQEEYDERLARYGTKKPMPGPI